VDRSNSKRSRLSGCPYIWGTKNPRADFFPNSASQTSVKFAISLSRLHRPSTTLFYFFRPGSFAGNSNTLSNRKRTATPIFVFSAKIFKSLPLLDSQRTFKKHTANEFRRKRFLKKLLNFFRLSLRREPFPRELAFKEQGCRQ